MFGERVKEIRESKGIKQSFVVGKLNKNVAWLSNIENGKTTKIDPCDIRDLAAVLGEPIEKFFNV